MNMHVSSEHTHIYAASDNKKRGGEGEREREHVTHSSCNLAISVSRFHAQTPTFLEENGYNTQRDTDKNDTHG